MLLRVVLYFLLIISPLAANDPFTLKDNLGKAKIGDYIVAAQNKTYTLMRINEKGPDSITIEEISIPQVRVGKGMIWRSWINQGFPGNTNRVISNVQLSSGRMQNSYSVTQNAWLDLSQGNQILSNLLNLPLYILPPEARKRCGPSPGLGHPDRRPFWQPRMVVEGQVIPQINFFAYRTRWPQDGGPMSSRMIDLYIPEDSERYPAYFPYWIEVHGVSGSKASVRVIDSGSCK